MKKILIEAVNRIMGENNQSSNGDLYLIPEDGGQPIKMPGIISASGVELASHDELDEMAFSLCDLQDMHFSLELTWESARRMKRFFRSNTRYVRRHKQQAKRKLVKIKNKMKKQNVCDGFDIDLFIELAKEYGAEVRPANPGEGGIYVKGKKITAEELFGDMHETEL